MTDHGKISKKGLMTLELDDSGKYITKTEGTGDPAKVKEQYTFESMMNTCGKAVNEECIQDFFVEGGNYSV